MKVTDKHVLFWGGQDGMYNNFPIVRIYRDGQYTRCYALDSHGGVAFLSSNLDRRDSE